MRITRRNVVLSAAATLTIPFEAHAQAYPSKPIRLIVLYGPSSGSDVTARIFAQFLSEEMKTSIVVENREGANGIIGTVAAAKTAPDGYTLLFIAPPFTYGHLMVPEVSYEPFKEFRAVVRLVTNPVMVVGGKSQPFKTFKELIAYAKANPGRVQYATSGKGTASHLEVSLIAQRYGVDMIDIPYRAFGPAITDVIAGRIHFYMSSLPAMLPHIQAGAVNPLIVGTAQRSSKIPDVPTFAEEYGEPGLEVGVWSGIVAPTGTPDEVVKYIHEKVQIVLKNQTLQEKIEATGSTQGLMDGKEFDTFLRGEGKKWDKVMQDLGLKQLKT